MKRPGQIALTPFPHTDLSGTKLRPVLLLRRTSRRIDAAAVVQLDNWLDGIFDAANVEDLIGPPSG